MTPTAIVTGGSRGIGKAIAIALAQEGFNVVVNYARNAVAAQEVQAAIQAAGAKAHLVQADVSVAADRQRLVDETIAAFGRIDLLINNAGVAPDVRADILQASEASFDRLIGINLKGPHFLTQLVANKMLEQIKGTGTISSEKGTGAISQSAMGNPQSAIPNPQSAIPTSDPSCLRASVPSCLPQIITISSVSAYAGSVNRSDYCIAKAGLAMMTQLYAARLAAHGINVYEIRPGVIETDMTGPVKAKYDDLIFNKDLTPIKRWGHGDDVAKAVIAITRNLLPFSTGEVINVDGGFHLRRL